MRGARCVGARCAGARCAVRGCAVRGLAPTKPKAKSGAPVRVRLNDVSRMLDNGAAGYLEKA